MNCHKDNTDRRLVALAQAGHPLAFETLVSRYRRPITMRCQRILRDEADANDAAQDTLLRAYLALPRYRPKGSFGAWLARIATNVCWDMLRKRRVRARAGNVPVEAAFMEAFHLQENPACDWDWLTETLATLPRYSCLLLHLKYTLEMTDEEIGLRVGCSASQIGGQLFQIRRRLREALAHNHPEEVAVETRGRMGERRGRPKRQPKPLTPM